MKPGGVRCSLAWSGTQVPSVYGDLRHCRWRSRGWEPPTNKPLTSEPARTTRATLPPQAGSWALRESRILEPRASKRAVLERIRVDDRHRRLGYGRVLVTAALTLAPDYAWSTARVPDDPVVRAFWASVSWPGDLGSQAWCTDMDRASGRLPDW